MKLIANWQLPIKTANEANSSEHWTKKAKRRKMQRWMIKAALRAEPLIVALPERRNDDSHFALCKIRIVLSRIAPRNLDSHDNLPMAFKGIVDAISEELTGNYVAGRADDADWITWEYRQEKGKVRQYAVRIEIYENQ